MSALTTEFIPRAMAGVECAVGLPSGPRDSFIDFPDLTILPNSLTSAFATSLLSNPLQPAPDASSVNLITINPEALSNLGVSLSHPMHVPPKRNQVESPMPDVSDVKKLTRHAKLAEAYSGAMKLQNTSKTKQRRSTGRRRTATQPKTPMEREKREIRLRKNREAASKCRARKKDWVENIEGRYKDLAASNKLIKAEVEVLTNTVYDLKNMVLQHTDCGYAPIDAYLQTAVKKAQANVRTRSLAENSALSSPPERHGSIALSDANISTDNASISTGDYGNMSPPPGITWKGMGDYNDFTSFPSLSSTKGSSSEQDWINTRQQI